MPITNLIRDNWRRFQGELFPEIQDAVGPLLKKSPAFCNGAWNNLPGRLHSEDLPKKRSTLM